MTDPREEKLPKWAQEILHKERLRADLAWPPMPRPEPFCVADDIGDTTGKDPRGMILYEVTSGQFWVQVRAVDIDTLGYVVHGKTRAKISGAYYETKADALLDAWWRKCDNAAASIHRAANAWREEASDD